MEGFRWGRATGDWEETLATGVILLQQAQIAHPHFTDNLGALVARAVRAPFSAIVVLRGRSRVPVDLPLCWSNAPQAPTRMKTASRLKTAIVTTPMPTSTRVLRSPVRVEA